MESNANNGLEKFDERKGKERKDSLTPSLYICIYIYVGSMR